MVLCSQEPTLVPSGKLAPPRNLSLDEDNDGLDFILASLILLSKFNTRINLEQLAPSLKIPSRSPV